MEPESRSPVASRAIPTIVDTVKPRCRKLLQRRYAQQDRGGDRWYRSQRHPQEVTAAVAACGPLKVCRLSPLLVRQQICYERGEECPWSPWPFHARSAFGVCFRVRQASFEALRAVSANRHGRPHCVVKEKNEKKVRGNAQQRWMVRLLLETKWDAGRQEHLVFP